MSETFTSVNNFWTHVKRCAIPHGCLLRDGPCTGLSFASMFFELIYSLNMSLTFFNFVCLNASTYTSIFIYYSISLFYI